MKISASIYSSKDKELFSLIKELDAYNVDFFHLDSLDNPDVFDDISNIHSVSKTNIDLHLITPSPEKYYDLISRHNIENVTFQFESLKNGMHIPENIKSNIGLAITSETPLEVFDRYADVCSFILFMTTTPGMSGGEFNKENFKKIRQFRTQYPDKKIHVDGGINAELSFILRNMGVYAAVIGSYLFKGSFIGSAMLNLKSDNIKSHYNISDFMLDFDEIPVLKYDNLTFENVLIAIENYKLGFTNVVDSDNRLLGIISNADIRKGLIRNLNDLNNINIDHILNRTPAFVYDSDTVSEVLTYIKSLKFPVLFLPVVDKDHKITGTIKFNNLIKGES
jgi:pentose-5-phosphate-3-epimerase/CBS domain-containing protein